MKEEYEKYCRFYRCEEKECWYNGCKCEGERLIIKEPKQETLEETAENFWLNDDSMTDNDRISYVNGFGQGAKWQQEFNDTSQVTRVEVIQHSEPYNGRAYTNYNAKEVEIQFQDRGKTLKIFLK